jgi:thiamine biosynthesis lipoprotein ApbE
MRADALATACMVLGADQALQMMDRAEDAACYLIIAENDSLTTLTSSNWDKMLTK